MRWKLEPIRVGIKTMPTLRFMLPDRRLYMSLLRKYGVTNKMMKPSVLFLVGLFMLMPAMAEDEPPPQEPQEGAENLEPEVTIVQEDDRTTYEYSINGRRYMVKIVPKWGPAYYLLDLDGDGEMDTQEDDPASIVIPQWVLFRW